MFRCAKAKVVTIDGNNKDCPLSIGDFIAKLEIGYDLVQGSRFIKGGEHKNTPFFRYIAIRLIHAPMLSFFWIHVDRYHSGL